MGSAKGAFDRTVPPTVALDASAQGDDFNYDSFDRAIDSGRPVGFTSVEEIIDHNAGVEDDIRNQDAAFYGDDENIDDEDARDGDGQGYTDEDGNVLEDRQQQRKQGDNTGQASQSQRQLTDAERGLQAGLQAERRQRQEAETASSFRMTVPEYRAAQAEATNNNFADVASYHAARQAQNEFTNRTQQVTANFDRRKKEISDDPNMSDEAKRYLIDIAQDSRDSVLRNEQSMFEQAVVFHRQSGVMKTFQENASENVIENARKILGGNIKPELAATLRSMPPAQAQALVDQLGSHLGPLVDNRNAKYAADLGKRQKQRSVENSQNGAPLPPMNPQAGQGGRGGNSNGGGISDIRKAITTSWTGHARNMKDNAHQRRNGNNRRGM